MLSCSSIFRWSDSRFSWSALCRSCLSFSSLILRSSSFFRLFSRTSSLRLRMCSSDLASCSDSFRTFSSCSRLYLAANYAFLYNSNCSRRKFSLARSFSKEFYAWANASSFYLLMSIRLWPSAARSASRYSFFCNAYDIFELFFSRNMSWRFLFICCVASSFAFMCWSLLWND